MEGKQAKHSKWKYMSPPSIEPATLWFLAGHLDRLAIEAVDYLCFKFLHGFRSKRNYTRQWNECHIIRRLDVSFPTVMRSAVQEGTRRRTYGENIGVFKMWHRKFSMTTLSRPAIMGTLIQAVMCTSEEIQNEREPETTWRVFGKHDIYSETLKTPIRNFLIF